MEITKSQCCHRLCLSNAVACPHCGKPFQPGALGAKATAENSAFMKKIYIMFIAAFLILPPALFLIQGYVHRLR